MSYTKRYIEDLLDQGIDILHPENQIIEEQYPESYVSDCCTAETYHMKDRVSQQGNLISSCYCSWCMESCKEVIE